MNKNGEKTKLLAVIAVFAMVVCALVAFAPAADADATPAPEGAIQVDSADDIKKAISEAKGDISLELTADFTVSEYINISSFPYNIAIYGGNHTITAGANVNADQDGNWTGNGTKNILHIENVAAGKTVTVYDVTFDSNDAAFGVNLYNNSGKIVLNNVASIDSQGAGFVVNSSVDVTMTGCSASGYLWGGVNVDNSTSSQNAATLKVDSVANLGSVYSESFEAADKGSSIVFENDVAAVTMSTENGAWMGYYTDIDEVFKVYSEKTTAAHDAWTNAVSINVLDDVTFDATDLSSVNLNNNTTLNVNTGASLAIGTGKTVSNAGIVNNGGAITGGLTNTGTLNAAPGSTTSGVTNSGTINAYSGANVSMTEGSTAVTVPTDDRTASTFDELKTLIETGFSVTYRGGSISESLTVSNGQTITVTASDLTVADGAVLTNNGTINLTPDSQQHFTLRIADGGTFVNHGSSVGMKIATADNSMVEMSGVSGDYTVTNGSIYINGNLYPTDDSVQAVITITGTMELSGSVTGNVKLAGNGEVVFMGDFSVNNGARLTIGEDIGGIDHTITVGYASDDVNDNFFLYGTIVSENDAEKTIAVSENSTFRAYSGAELSSDITVNGKGTVDLSQAQSVLTVRDDMAASVEYGQLQSIVIDGVLSIRNNSTIIIHGDLTINEGTILTIESGSHLVVEGKVATVSVDGTVEIVDGASFEVREADDVTVSGTISSYGTVSIPSADAGVTIAEGGVIRINNDDNSSIIVNGGLTIEAGGLLEVSSYMDINNIANKGTVTLSNAALTGDSIISLTAAGAVVNIVSVTGADDGTNTAQTYTLTINDSGLEFADSTPTRPHKVTDAADVNSLDFTLNENVGISGIIVSEVVTTENRVMYNNMDISGTVATIDDRENIATGDQGVSVTVNVAGPRLQVSEALTLGARITMAVGGDMTVSGTVTAVSDKSDITIGNGEITVTGLIQMTEKIDATDKLNAAYYATQANGTTPAYNWYTNFVDAVAANPATVYVYGEVSVLEDVTVPATMTVRIEGSNSVLTVGDDDNRDVTLTIANGANVRGNQITVDGTVYFENKRNDSVSRVISDVRIEGDADRTYTNIYTALANAEAGETVTITSDEVVWLTSNLTIPAGVTLDVPNTKYIGLDAGVTLTVDGTLRTAHPVQVRIDADTVEDDGSFTVGDFDTEAANTTDKKASAIVVNGTFMTMVGFDEYGYDYYAIPGAYYQVIDSNGIYNYVTPVEAAAAVSANATDGQFDIYGTVNSGDVTFTSSDAVDVTVTVKAGAKYTASSITLVGATLETEAAAGTVAAGLFSGTVIVGDASIEAVNVRNMTVGSENGLTIVNADVKYDDPKTTTVNPDASLNATAGTVIVDYVDGDMTVDTGATVTVPNVTSGTRNVDGTVTGDLYVDGTVTVSGGQTLTVSGALYVDGTVTVAAATDSATAGNLYVGTNTNGDREGTMYVGLDDEFATTGASAAVTGTVNVPTIYAAAGTTVDAATVEDMETTAYYVEGAVWINAYGDGNIVVSGMENAPVENAYFNNVWQNEAGDKKYALSTAVQTGSTNPAIGAVDAVYAIIDYNVYHIIVLANQAVDDVTVDGNLMTYGMIPTGETLFNGQIYYGYMITVSAGDHEILYTLANGYSGEGVLSCVSDNATVNGLSFNAAGTPETADGISIVLQLSGFEKTGYVPESPDTGSDSGDSGMTITDYLLIVLVVLIIVMAIIVAMRLMRS